VPVRAAVASLVLLALAMPGVARAAEATIVARDLPVGKSRSLASRPSPSRFNVVGLHWQGAGSVRFRTRSVSGRWSSWQPAAPEAEDRPDVGAEEHGRPGWRLGNPYFAGTSDRIEYRLRGQVRRLRAWFVWSPPAPAPPRTLAVAGSPAIVPRLSWGANESIRRGVVSYAPALRFALVHHTAGSNSYTRAESAAIVRGIELYHVRGNGWNDIGYNFLVDRYGQIFEGRYGGITRNVIGAHAGGFNTGSVGVSLLGNYDGVAPPAAARDALAALIAWRLDVAHVDPLSTVTAISGGNERFQSGVPVLLRAISGHRDTGFTTCPGDVEYRRIPELAHAVAALGLPKLYAPAVQGMLGEPVRFSARLSEALPWTVTITDAAGALLAHGSGTGKAIGWTWDSGSVPPGRGYVYTIAAGSSVRPARGTLGKFVPVPLLTRPLAEPPIVSPNGDGRGDVTVISYALGTSATVTATLVAPGGVVLATLFSETQPPGENRFTFVPEFLLDGTYRVVLSAVTPAGRKASVTASVLVSRTLTSFALSPAVFSPNGDGRRDVVRFQVEVAAPAAAQLRILRGAAPVAVPFAATLPAGVTAVPWDGRGATGVVRDAAYTAELQLSAGVTVRAPLRVDTRAPTLRFLSRRPVRLWVGEAARVVVVADGRRIVVNARRGRVPLSLSRQPRRLRAVAYDEAGNASGAATLP
jgi:hypothetical protein